MLLNDPPSFLYSSVEDTHFLCPLPDLDALPFSCPDRSRNGKAPPATSSSLWDAERSGLKGTIRVSDSKRRGPLQELIICVLLLSFFLLSLFLVLTFAL